VGYFSHISAEDEEMGRLMKKLSQLGIADNTIVCFSSDHGDMLGSFGRYGKNVPWEESIRVPFLVRWPAGIPAGKRLDTLFSTVDVAPTLLWPGRRAHSFQNAGSRYFGNFARQGCARAGFGFYHGQRRRKCWWRWSPRGSPRK